jgi:acetyltransferase-like isoleucine patch superfamily enzyme
MLPRVLTDQLKALRARLWAGVVLAGSCRVGRGAFLSAGCVMSPELSIGAGAVVGTGAVVIGDVAAGDVVVGNPVRPLPRSRHRHAPP